MDQETEKKVEELSQMQEQLLQMLGKMESDYKTYPEYNTIKMGLSNCIKELNAIRVKVVVKDTEVNRPDKDE